MAQNKETIKNLIESGSKILVAAEPSCEETTIFAMLALKNILEEAGKNVFFCPSLKESFLKKFEKIVSYENNNTLPQKIKIKIPKNIPLEEMSYEEEDDFLNLIISPKSALEPENLLIEKSPYEMDAAFCFFTDESFWEKIAAPIAKPASEKIIYFANKEKTLAEKIRSINDTLENLPRLSARAATYLYASLVFETENFQFNQEPELFGLAKELLEAGADKKALQEAWVEEKRQSATQLIGRALARTSSEENLQTSWTFLTKQDFLKTGMSATKENILFILRRVRSQIIHAPCSILCYENEQGINSVVFHQDKNVLKILSQGLGISPESSYFFVYAFKNFSEAEAKIKELLKGVLSAKIKSNAQ